MDEEYLAMLRRYVEENLQNDPALKEQYAQQSQNRSPAEFLTADFDAFFKLAVPKTIISLLWEEDWEIDAASGVKVFEFERETPSESVPNPPFYHVGKADKSPRRRARSRTDSRSCQEKLSGIVRRVFSTRADDVAELLRESGKTKFALTYNKVKAHRRKTVSG